jgi:pSer/pThr/pTyr-binding forkhead associated (FHA) protein
LIVAPGGRAMPLPVQDEAWVGRRDTVNAFTPDVDLTDIDVDRSLSRRHARILRRDGRLFVIEAPGARNGTFVNGQRLGETEAELSDGDRVRFGLVDTVLRVTET